MVLDGRIGLSRAGNRGPAGHCVGWTPGDTRSRAEHWRGSCGEFRVFCPALYQERIRRRAGLETTGSWGPRGGLEGWVMEWARGEETRCAAGRREAQSLPWGLGRGGAAERPCLQGRRAGSLGVTCEAPWGRKGHVGGSLCQQDDITRRSGLGRSSSLHALHEGSLGWPWALVFIPWGT